MAIIITIPAFAQDIAIGFIVLVNNLQVKTASGHTLSLSEVGVSTRCIGNRC